VDHLGDSVETYAFGLLEPHERFRADAHLRGCAACAARVGEAEAVVAALTEATVEPRCAPAALRSRIPVADAFGRRSARLQPWRRVNAWIAAAAAVLVLASASLDAQNHALETSATADGALLGALVDSHFSHAQFTGPDGRPIAAKVLFERHGRWYAIVATNLATSARVEVVRGAVVSEVDRRFVASGSAVTLTLPQLGRIDELRLRDAHGTLLGRVRPVLAAPDR
jgi:hypothetical protein